MEIEEFLPLIQPSETDSFGLYSKKTNHFIPLKNIEISVKIINSIAYISQTQEYFNPTNQNLEVIYFFPKSSSSVFDKMTIEFKDKIIEFIYKTPQKLIENKESAMKTNQKQPQAKKNKKTMTSGR